MIFKEEELYILKKEINKLKSNGKTIVWTNGCFDIIHPGHIKNFKKAKKYGDILVVGINGDKSSYWKTKPGRPINDENFRSQILDAIKYIDYIYIFNDETPVRLVNELKPDIVIKGGDYIQDSLKHLVEKKDDIYDLTKAYKFIIKSGNEKLVNERGFMPEGKTNVLNGGKVYVIPNVKGYSTTNIIKKILQVYKN